MNDLTPLVQRHIANVFAALAGALVAATLGVVTYLYTHVSGSVAGLACLGFILWLAFDSDKENLKKRLMILAAFGFFKGIAIGGLVEVVLMVDASILVTATLGTTAIFLCFAGAALTAKRRSFFYLQGVLGSALMLMLVISLVSWFFPSALAFNIQLYGGLLVFCGYVVLDTQMMVEKAVMGSRDVAMDALDLFIDFIAIFVRICIILLKNAENKDKRNSNSKRR